MPPRVTFSSCTRQTEDQTTSLDRTCFISMVSQCAEDSRLVRPDVRFKEKIFGFKISETGIYSPNKVLESAQNSQRTSSTQRSRSFEISPKVSLGSLCCVLRLIGPRSLLLSRDVIYLSASQVSSITFLFRVVFSKSYSSV